jgi:DNA-directed RNA polymerase specialized sigma24 family protein/quercetin dioxygenase-like cupin family protein
VSTPATLGDVLYRDNPGPASPESDWAALIGSVAAGDQVALQALYERTHRVVFTLILRLTSDRALAEQLTLDFFAGLWRDAARYDRAQGSVLAWMMNRARAVAMERLRAAAPNAARRAAFKRQAGALRAALVALTQEEREAIEAAYFEVRPYAELRAALGPLRSGLHHLRRLLAAEANQALPLASAHNRCQRTGLVCLYALHAVPPEAVTAIEAHIVACGECEKELEALRPTIESFVAWPTDVLRSPPWLQRRLAMRIAAEAGAPPALPAAQWREPEWKQVTPEISCKLLSVDAHTHTVGMLVRLAPGGRYPAHVHAGVEELHLLEGELWIDERKLYPGEYNRAEPGTADALVWSGTGCTCVLITNAKDTLA